MKYKISKEMYDGSLKQKDADQIEMQVNILTSQDHHFKTSSDSGFGIFLLPALYLINFNRYLIGKEPIGELLKQETVSYLEIAY